MLVGTVRSWEYSMVEMKNANSANVRSAAPMPSSRSRWRRGHPGVARINEAKRIRSYLAPFHSSTLKRAGRRVAGSMSERVVHTVAPSTQ